MFLLSVRFPNIVASSSSSQTLEHTTMKFVLTYPTRLRCVGKYRNQQYVTYYKLRTGVGIALNKTRCIDLNLYFKETDIL
jgi:hypothetical protein